MDTRPQDPEFNAQQYIDYLNLLNPIHFNAILANLGTDASVNSRLFDRGFTAGELEFPLQNSGVETKIVTAENSDLINSIANDMKEFIAFDDMKNKIGDGSIKAMYIGTELLKAIGALKGDKEKVYSKIQNKLFENNKKFDAVWNKLDLGDIKKDSDKEQVLKSFIQQAIVFQVFALAQNQLMKELMDAQPKVASQHNEGPVKKTKVKMEKTKSTAFITNAFKSKPKEVSEKKPEQAPPELKTPDASGIDIKKKEKKGMFKRKSVAKMDKKIEKRDQIIHDLSSKVETKQKEIAIETPAPAADESNKKSYNPFKR